MKKNIFVFAIMALLFSSALLTLGAPNVSAATATLGQPTQSGTSASTLNTIKGAQYLNTVTGQAASVSAYFSYTPSTGDFGQHTKFSLNFVSIDNSIRGQAFTTPAYPVVATSVSARIFCTMSHDVKAAIYDASGNLVAYSNPVSLSAPTTADRTFMLTTNPVLSASTTYILVVWAQDQTADANLVYTEETSNSRVVSATYGDWPSSVSFSTQTNRNYFIWCNYETVANVQCALYSADGTTKLAVTEQKILTSTTGKWVTFNLNTNPTLTANTKYVLAAWSSDSGAKLFYNGATAPAFTGSGTFATTTLSSSGTKNYNLYATLQYNTITASAGTGGSINPSGNVNVAANANQQFSITPDSGYHIKDVLVDDNSVGAVSTYTFYSVVTDHTISATFEAALPTTVTVSCTPDTIQNDGSQSTTISGSLTASGTPLNGQTITLSYNDDTWHTIGTATTQLDGSYTYNWATPDLPNGFYVVKAEFTGDENTYQSSSAETTSSSQGGGLFVVPEYSLGVLGALGACLAGFVVVRARRSLHK
ncbi:MAG: hypothetical protein NWE92_07995 [Candidatus Bathyarchaeota archaeon]|nr:hypothetical protein [Candidatus Bathyarchaeota archaeon]